MKLRYIGTIALTMGAVLCANTSSAKTKFTYDGNVITFEQVYKNPENMDLRLNYARQQAAAGDYLSAAGALEAMLYSQPNWDSARIFYALLLFELDDKLGARRELDILLPRQLTAQQRNIADKLMKKLRRKVS